MRCPLSRPGLWHSTGDMDAGSRASATRTSASTADGGSVVFKLCHPAEGDAILRCQAEALEHIAWPIPLPVPRLRRTLDGERCSGASTHEGAAYPVMVLSWLEGERAGRGSAVARRRFTISAGCWRGSGWRCAASSAAPRRSAIWSGTRATSCAWRRRSRICRRRTARSREESWRAIARSPCPPCGACAARSSMATFIPTTRSSAPTGVVSGIIDFGDMVHGAAHSRSRQCGWRFPEPRRRCRRDDLRDGARLSQRHAAGGGRGRLPDRPDRGPAADDAADRRAEGRQRHRSPRAISSLQRPQHADDPRSCGRSGTTG